MDVAELNFVVAEQPNRGMHCAEHGMLQVPDESDLHGSFAYVIR